MGKSISSQKAITLNLELRIHKSLNQYLDYQNKKIV